MALRAFFIGLSKDTFIGENRDLRITMEGQIYQGQLAEQVTQGPVLKDGKLQLIAIPDTNDDELPHHLS